MNEQKLVRDLSLIAVVAAALCNVIGGGINVLIVEIQNEVIGIGDLIPIAMVIAGFQAFLISLVYASISTAFSEPGGEYLYVSRGITQSVGFVMAFVKWAGAVIIAGTVAYMDVLIFRDAMMFLGIPIYELLNVPIFQAIGALVILWFFWLINYFGVKTYGRTVIFLATLMFLGGAAMVFLGFSHTHSEFLNIVGDQQINNIKPTNSAIDFFRAVAMLFWAYIGFTSIAQSAGELKNWKKNLPKAFIISTIIVTAYYVLYSAAFYHAVPWQYVVGKENLTVPGLLGLFLPNGFAVIISLFVFIALANDLPPMIYTKSRLFYSWAKDGLLPKIFLKVNNYGVPSFSLTIVTMLASLVSILCAFTNFFEEVNVVVFSRFFIYLLVALATVNMPQKNPAIYKKISFLKNKKIQTIVSVLVILISMFYILVLAYSDITSTKPFFLKSTVQTAIITLIGIVTYKVVNRKIYKREKKN